MIRTIQSYSRQFSFSSLFGKCGKFANKLVSIALAVVLMCSFALPTFAASDGTEDIIASELDLHVEESVNNSDWYENPDSFSSGIWNRNSFTQFNGFHYVTLQVPNVSGVHSQLVMLTETLDLTSDHEYRLSFDYGVSNYGVQTVFGVELVYFNSNGEEISSTNLYINESISNTNVNSVDFSFKVDSSSINSGYTCKLRFEFLRIYSTSGVIGYSHFFISENIIFVDKDDDSGWFQKIINKIEETINNIKQIPEKINQKLTELKEGIVNAFVELKDNLIEGLKGLFVPSEGFFDEKKAEMETFLEDHFGIIYTAPNIVITIFEKLLTISPGEPALTMPAIEFNFLGEHIKLSDPITINLYDFVAKGTPLYTIYQFYRAGSTASLIFLFVNYAINRYNYLFGKDGEAVN